MAGGDVVVMEMHFIRVGDADACVPYAIQPGASMHDCSFVEKSTADSQLGFALNTNGPCSSPYRHPFPADGAVNVPLKTVLNWASPGGVFACGTPVTAAPAVAAGTERVYFGTTPNPPYDESATYYNGVGPLLPETTYYWQINAQFPPPFASPVWSFTTMSTVPTTPTTWGSIKALYR